VQISEKAHRQRKALVKEMDKEFQLWIKHWRELSDYFLPRRQPWLMTQRQRTKTDWRNTTLLDSTSIEALRILSNGMMDGITSPARPWFRLRISGVSEDQLPRNVKVYFESIATSMLQMMAATNFYDTLAVTYQDWAGMGSGMMVIREDAKELFRAYNQPVGSFRFATDAAGRVNRASVNSFMSVEDIVKEFGLDNVTIATRGHYEAGGARLLHQTEVVWLVEENTKDMKLPALGKAEYRELYWERGQSSGEILAVRPLMEWPGACPRWAVHGNMPYGNSPTMDALGDVKQLQHMLRRRGQALDKMVDPPLLVDNSLANRPTALHARGVTYANLNAGARGAVPVHTFTPPLQEMNLDIQDLRERIRDTLHNKLFTMISQLDTVRSASEIAALKEEKLVLLGPVLERIQHEGLDPLIKRVYGIMSRAGLFPPVPQELEGIPLDIQYVSVLSDAQRAVGTVSTERFLALTGNLVAVYPEMRLLPNIEELMRDYATSIGVKASGLHSREEFAQAAQAEQQQQQLQQQAAVGAQMAQGAQQLSNTDVGGGMNALQMMLNGGG